MNYSDKTPNQSPKGIIFTDFDGTLFNSERFITEENYKALKEARTAGYITVIATGRSLFSFRRVAENLDRPIEDYFDYLIFSSGAGLIRSDSRIRGFKQEITADDLLETENLNPSTAFDAAGLLFRRGIDFMIQKPVPLNHHFVHVKANGAVNPDYYQRIRIYDDFAEPLNPGDGDSDLEQIEKVCNEGVCQLVGIVPPSGTDNEKYISELLDYLQHRLCDCTVIRTTSPIDHNSVWIEVFNPEVSKSQSADRLTRSLGLKACDALAVGNDFNDEDMLHWAGTGRSVDEAPARMQQAHPSAGRSIDSAVAAAVREFIADRNYSPVRS